MPNIYITDETRKALDLLTEAEKRSISGEIDFLVSERVKKIIDEKIPLVKIGPGGFARELNGSEPIVA